MEIITEGYPKGDQIMLDRISATYYQENDCTESDEEGQELTIETRDGGGGKFFYIKTSGWSFDSDAGIDVVINDFKNRIK